MRSKNILDAPDESEVDKETPKKLAWVKVAGMVAFVLGVTFKIQHWPYASFFLMAGVVLVILWDVIQLTTGKFKNLTDWAYFIGRLCLFAYFIIPAFINMQWYRLLLFPAGIAFGVGIVYSTFVAKKE